MTTYKGIRTNSHTLIPEIVDIEFEIRHFDKGNLAGEDWLYVTKGGVTGYESAQLKEMVDSYLERSVFTTWTACMGTLNKYPRLEIPMSEVIKFLKDQGLIEVTYEYGYPKKIIWKDDAQVLQPDGGDT